MAIAVKPKEASEAKRPVSQSRSAEVNINKVVDSMNQLEGATAKLTDTTKKGRAQSGLNNAILLETGRLASDASFGFTAIANNLSQVVTLFASFVETNKGVIASFKALGSSLLGIGGFLIAVQLLISFGPKLLQMFRDLIGGSTALADVFKKSAETVSDLNGKFELYIRTLQDSTKSDEEKQIALKKLNEEFPDFIQQLNESGVSTENLKDKTKEAKKQTDLYRQSIIDLAIARAAADKIEELATEQLDILIKRREKLIDLDFENEQAAEKRLAKAKEELVVAKENFVLGDQTVNQLNNEISAIEKVLTFKDRKLNKLDEEINLLLHFTQISEDSNEKETKGAEDKYKKLLELLESYTQKVLLNTAVTEQQRLKIQEEAAIKEAVALGASQDQLLIIRRYYAQEALKIDKKLRDDILANRKGLNLEASEFQEEELTKEEKQLRERAETLLQVDKEKRQQGIDDFLEQKQIELNTETDVSEALTKIKKEETEARLEFMNMVGSGLASAAELAGKSTGTGKALAVAGTLISTYAAAQKAFESQYIVSDPSSKFRAIIAAASATAAGLARVKAIMAVKTPAMKGGSVTGGSAGLGTVQAPSFNVVGAGQANQLGEAVAGTLGQPVRAYVVTSDINTGQALERNITDNAALG